MEPTYALNRSYWDSPADCLQQWLDAYAEIGERHPELATTVERLTVRIRKAYALFGGLANLGGMADDTVYAERVEQENKYYSQSGSLDGDFPLGNEREVFEARYLFSIREMAWLQAGLAAEIDPADLSQVPRDKVYTFGDPQERTDKELAQERAAFIEQTKSRYPSSNKSGLKSMLGKVLLGVWLLLSASGLQAQSVKIIFAGDLMGHMPQVNAAQQADGSYDYSPCFRYVKDYIQSADLAILNLEVPLDGRPYSGYPQFSSPDALAADAKEAGFDIMTTANNHCMDRGRHGLERTLRALDSLGIPHLGTYRNRQQRDTEHPMMVERNGFRIALLSYTYGTNGIPAVEPNIVNLIDTAEMARDLRVARDRGADFVITLIHWGIEYVVKANREQEQTARWLLEHGCDVVIGGHPHVVQNFTIDANPANDRFPEIVVYSMGNLVSNQRDVNTDGGIMIELTLAKTHHSEFITQNCKYVPYWVYRGTIDSLYQYYIVPSADAVAHPDFYQIKGNDFKSLQTFDSNTRQRLEACRLKNGSNIEERSYEPSSRRTDGRHPGVVPLRCNPLLREKIAR